MKTHHYPNAPEPNPKYDEVKCCEFCGTENDVDKHGICEDCNIQIQECYAEDREREID